MPYAMLKECSPDLMKSRVISGNISSVASLSSIKVISLGPAALCGLRFFAEYTYVIHTWIWTGSMDSGELTVEKAYPPYVVQHQDDHVALI